MSQKFNFLVETPRGDLGPKFGVWAISIFLDIYSFFENLSEFFARTLCSFMGFTRKKSKTLQIVGFW